MPMTGICSCVVSRAPFDSYDTSRAESVLAPKTLQPNVPVHRRRDLIPHVGILNFLVPFCDGLRLLLRTLLSRWLSCVVT
jgi:hypothetical protein